MSEVVFVGMRLPLIAFVVAKKTHAPRAIGLFENGVIRDTPALELIYTMADPPNLLGAMQCLDMIGVMSLLQSGARASGISGGGGSGPLWKFELDRGSRQARAYVGCRVREALVTSASLAKRLWC